MTFSDWSIRYKLTGLFVAMASIAALTVSVPMGTFDFLSLKHAMSQDLGLLAEVLARNSTAALTFRDAKAAQDVLEALRAEPSITAACIYTDDGKAFAQYVRARKGSTFTPPLPRDKVTVFENGRLFVFRDIILEGESVGTIYIESDLQRLHARVRDYNIALFITLSVTFSLAFVLSPFLQRPISRPLLDLVRTTKAISGGMDYSIRADVSSRDEFGSLVAEFNGMLDQIQKRDQELRLHREHLEEEVAARTDELSTANDRLRLLAAALEAAANSILITDLTGRVVWTNPAFTELSGYAAKEILGANPRLLRSGRQDKQFYGRMWATITSGATWRGEILNRHKDRSLRVEEMTITPVLSRPGEITHFVAVKQDITERKRAEEALRRAEEKYRGIFENAVIGIYQSTPDGRLLSVNRAAANICGFDSPEQQLAETRDLAQDLYQDPARRKELMRLLSISGVARDFECEIRRRDGKKAWLLQNVRAVRNEQGETVTYEGTVHDITERKLLEDQLRQAQKMEAVGRLAGGVAHDFNNALSVIMGYGQLLQLNTPSEDTTRKHAEQIVKAGQRAATLTRQLLAFSRKQTIQPVILDLNSIVSDTNKMLCRLIGEDIDLTITQEAKLKRVKADRGQIEQILMNLAVNARDAMPSGGELTIATSNCELGPSDVEQHPFIKPGRYILLSFTDTGCGMTKEIKTHIFEPFFTTKEAGKGTGLGLSTVYGIVKQSEGFVLVDSEVNKGTTFRIYLPEVELAAQPRSLESVPVLPRGSETVLLAEDEEPLRELTRGCLQRSGYTVLEAHDAKTAIQLADQHHGPIHLLLTDVVMPGISGRDLAEQLMPAHPEMKLLYMSGYTHDLISQHGVVEADVALLEKPFSIETLLTRVRGVLDSRLARAVGTQ
jgi:two-component system, cell cycle sensor histidine kinase and response regulator CckA